MKGRRVAFIGRLRGYRPRATWLCTLYSPARCTGNPLSPRTLGLPARSPATLLAHAWPALPATAVIAFVLLRLGFDQGGYFPAAYTSAGAIAFMALAVLVVRPAQERLSTHALIAIGALAAFACWIGLSRAWSVVPDVPLLDMQRAMLYLALFGLGLLAADSGRNARVLVWSLLGVVVASAGRAC